MFGVADDGRKVVLNEDGTWVYHKDVVTSAEEGSRGFRKLSWGAHRLDVKQSEPSVAWLGNLRTSLQLCENPRNT